MSEITGKAILDAYEHAMKATVPRTNTELGKLIHVISFNSSGRMAGQTTTVKDGDTFKSKANTFYWKWWLEGRGPVKPVRANFLHFFIKGQEIFTRESKPFKGHREKVEPLHLENVTKILGNQLDRFFNEL